MLMCMCHDCFDFLKIEGRGVIKEEILIFHQGWINCDFFLTTENHPFAKKKLSANGRCSFRKQTVQVLIFLIRSKRVCKFERKK